VRLAGALLAVLAIAATCAPAQHLTLEGQTGGFLTPSAYVVPSEKGHLFSHPAVGVHYIGAAKVIGNVYTYSVAEGVANRGEFGYTRSVHTLGDATATSSGAFSKLWDYSGMNIFSAKVVLIKDGYKCQYMPGVAVGAIVRTNDHFVSGHLNGALGLGSDKGYTNEDLYVAVTKTWLKPPVPLFINIGWKSSNAVLFGLGGQSTRMGGSFFGGVGFPLPGPKKTAIVPSVGFTQQPKTAVNMKYIMPAGVHIPTTLDYAVRITQAEHAHFSFDIGIGQVAGNIGTAVLATGLPSPYPSSVSLPVNLQARKVLGMGLSYRY